MSRPVIQALTRASLTVIWIASLNLHLLWVLPLSWKHQNLSQRVILGVSSWCSGCWAASLKFLHSVCISESIESMFAAGRRRGDISYHSRSAISCEWIFQDLGELRASEGGVLLGLIQSSNALLEREQWFVDLSTIHSSLFVGIDGVSSSLTAS